MYLVQRGDVSVLLCGGDKRTQEADIGRAAEIAKEHASADANRPKE